MAEVWWGDQVNRHSDFCQTSRMAPIETPHDFANTIIYKDNDSKTCLPQITGHNGQ